MFFLIVVITILSLIISVNFFVEGLKDHFSRFSSPKKKSSQTLFEVNDVIITITKKNV